MDENAQYFLLAVYWFATNPIAGKEEGGGEREMLRYYLLTNR